MSNKKQTSILITEENRQFLKDNDYKNGESYTACVNRLLDEERKKQSNNNNN